MQNQLMIRIGAAIVAVTLLFGGYKLFERWTMDPDIGDFESADMIVAVEYTDDGARIVLFDAKGNKTEAPKWQKGVRDQDPVWRPDGQRVFFLSNRQDESHNIFRWNPARNVINQKSRGSLSKSSPYFGPWDWPDLNDSGLITAGGRVLEFNQHEQKMTQLLPPKDFANENEAAMQGQARSVYESIGTTFVDAKWGKDRKVIFAVMHRETDDRNDKVFIIIYMDPIGDVPTGPVTMFAGQEIQFDVGREGTAVVSIQGFEFVDERNIPPELVKDGRLYKPYRNSLFMIKIGQDGQPDVTPLFTDFPDLGFSSSELNDQEREKHFVPAGIDGIVAEEVPDGTAGSIIGMASGDVLVAIDDTPVESIEMMRVLLRQRLFGEPIKIDYYAGSDDEPGMRTVTYQFGAEVGVAMRFPAISPDSNQVAVVVGKTVDDYTFIATDLLLAPMSAAGVSQTVRLVRGAIYEPRWHPGGRSLVYAKAGPAGDSQIYTIKVDGSGEKNVSGVGDYSSPSFSPSTKK